MNFGMIILNQSMRTIQHYVIWILTLLFIIHIKTEDFYKDIVDDVEKWFDTSNYSEDDNRPFPRGMNKKVTGFLKDELRR